MNVDNIDNRARDIKLTRVLLTIVAAVFFVLGWAARAGFSFSGLVLRWCLAACAEGWATRKGTET